MPTDPTDALSEPTAVPRLCRRISGRGRALATTPASRGSRARSHRTAERRVMFVFRGANAMAMNSAWRHPRTSPCAGRSRRCWGPTVWGFARVTSCVMPAIVRQSSRTCSLRILSRNASTEAVVSFVLGSRTRRMLAGRRPEANRNASGKMAQSIERYQPRERGQSWHADSALRRSAPINLHGYTPGGSRQKPSASHPKKRYVMHAPSELLCTVLYEAPVI